MFKKTIVRFITIAVAIVLACYSLWWTVAYNMMSPDRKEELRTAGRLKNYEDRIIRLGLDLKGGMHVILELNLPKLLESTASNTDESFQAAVRQAEAEYIQTKADFFDIFERIAGEKNLRLARYYNKGVFKNSEIVNQLREESKDAIQRALEIIRNRVDQFGVSEPNIQRASTYRIIVELAGIQDATRARELIQSTALLEFILVKDAQITQAFITAVDNYLKTGQKEAAVKAGLTPDTTVTIKESKDKAITVDDLLGKSALTETKPAEQTTDSTVIVDEQIYAERPFSSLLRNISGSIGVPEQNVYAVKKILADSTVRRLLPFDSRLLWSAKPERMTTREGATEKFYILYHVDREASLQGKYVTKAQESYGQSGSTAANQPIVNITLNNEGAKRFSQVTGSNINKRLALVLDDKVYVAPFIRVKVPHGAAYIEGLENMDEAKGIAIVLRAGALPAPVDIIEERTIGPSLGRDSIIISTRVGIIGFCLVILFMVIYYKHSGWLANLALLLNVIFVLAILASLRATLTLPGIAGLILTVGMAVDANVLIFERIREELAKGKTVRAAVDSGYSRALSTIIDANITTLFTAIILMQFGTGPVKGFAVTLFWGILCSLFTAIFVTHTIFNYVNDRKVLSKLSI